MTTIVVKKYRKEQTSRHLKGHEYNFRNATILRKNNNVLICLAKNVHANAPGPFKSCQNQARWPKKYAEAYFLLVNNSDTV